MLTTRQPPGDRIAGFAAVWNRRNDPTMQGLSALQLPVPPAGHSCFRGDGRTSTPRVAIDRDVRVMGRAAEGAWCCRSAAGAISCRKTQSGRSRRQEAARRPRLSLHNRGQRLGVPEPNREHPARRLRAADGPRHCQGSLVPPAEGKLGHDRSDEQTTLPARSAWQDGI